LADITILIKTFERSDCLRRLLRSIADRGYTYPVLVADDSREPYRSAVLEEFGDLIAEYLVLPFDVGLSAGRNAMLARVQTPYLLLCDDDFVFDERTDVPRMRRLLEANDLDLLGGVYYDQAPFSWRDLVLSAARLDWQRVLTLAGVEVPRRLYFNFQGCGPGKWKTVAVAYTPPVVRCDLASNFFLARTGRLRETVGGWDGALKVGEHRAFFLKAKHCGLRVGHTEEAGVAHLRDLPEKYIDYRRRIEAMAPREFVQPAFRERLAATLDACGRIYRHQRAMHRPLGPRG